MKRNYTITNTTKEERIKISNEALAISIIHGQELTYETKKLVSEYIDGKIDISSIFSSLN
ncbi:hypothetical protein [Clostridium uliginosum]|uniref:Antitoxin VbhA domain-containing protein n=1 Tax=Clostridium uliginosum TaxID=119641 RepID=A0A1I1MHZ7_9CLOT|nr:hypothetical protein [Clostridium uliginosum]SFC84746.1 hypothetical protein SAMN05421842_1112 [Clostridium uliginosum]